jgi:hypothetical protein
MSTDEEKYKSLRDQLRSLPHLKARKDFDSRLFARIKELENAKHVHHVHKPEKENIFVSWLANLLKPSLVPAIGLTVVLLAAIVVYFGYFNKLADRETQVQQEVSYADNKGEFVIYVKKDGERVYDETNRDITSADISGSTSTEYRAPSDVSTESVKPAPLKETDSEVHDKLDKISPEQKIEMEKEPSKFYDEDKVRSKGDDVIMKKGYNKNEEKKEAPSNYLRDETKDSGILDDNKNIQAPNEEINQQTESEEKLMKDSNRVTERRKSSKKDSTKVKGEKIEEQDSIEK